MYPASVFPAYLKFQFIGFCAIALCDLTQFGVDNCVGCLDHMPNSFIPMNPYESCITQA